MKTIGLIGGMSWESTAEYHRIINEEIAKRLGGLHSAQTLIYNVDFHPIEKLAREGKWDEIGDRMASIAQKLEQAGADFIMICSNATHHVAEMVEFSIGIPLLHIADAVADAVKRKNMTEVGMLGTVHISKYPFYRDRLRQHGLSVLYPDREAVDYVNRVIYTELCMGHFKEESKSLILRIMDSLAQKGAQGIILGCTELPLIIRQKDTAIPIFDTLKIHAEAAVSMALSTETVSELA